MLLPFLTLLGDTEDDPDKGPSDARSQIAWLRSVGDREALLQIMQARRQLTQGLEAAEALAELGDVRGLDHLIATLDSRSSFLQARAAEILMQLNHPRGLRALKDHQEASGRALPSPGNFHPGGTGREHPQELYDELNASSTDELVAIWHAHDRSQWSDLAFEVIESILMQRLGRLPPRNHQAADRSQEDIDPNADPAIRELWLQGDVNGLTRLFADEPDVSLRLEAAEALADLGDEEALDLLVEHLDDPDPEVSEMAAEILDWLDLPRGNSALRDRGFEFETGADNVREEPRPSPSSIMPGSAVSAPPRDSWVAAGRTTVTARAPQPLASSGTGAQAVWQQSNDSSRLSPVIVFTGAVGGVLGFMLFRIGLQFFGLLSLPEAPGDWLTLSMIKFLVTSVVTGGSFGTLGSRVAQALARRLGHETGEGDLTPVIGALVEGATAALLLDMLLFVFVGP